MINYQWDLIQNTDEWLLARLGILTASTMKHALSPEPPKETRIKKDGTPYKQKEWEIIADNEKTRAHVFQLANERITKRIGDNYESWDMQRGHIEEVHAKNKYMEKFGAIKDCGFVSNDELGFTIGFSPDAMVGIEGEGQVEVKSRNGKFQIETIIADEVPNEFNIQLQTGLWVTKRKWCDFISYSNGLPMFVKRVEPIQKYQDAISEAATAFEKKVKECLATYEENVAKYGYQQTEWIEHSFDSDDFTPSTQEAPKTDHPFNEIIL